MKISYFVLCALSIQPLLASPDEQFAESSSGPLSSTITIADHQAALQAQEQEITYTVTRKMAIKSLDHEQSTEVESRMDHAASFYSVGGGADDSLKYFSAELGQGYRGIWVPTIMECVRDTMGGPWDTKLTVQNPAGDEHVLSGYVGSFNYPGWTFFNLMTEDGGIRLSFRAHGFATAVLFSQVIADVLNVKYVEQEAVKSYPDPNKFIYFR